LPEPTIPVRLTTCSFCGKSSRTVGMMVEGPSDVYICVNCAHACLDIFAAEESKWEPTGPEPVPSAWLKHTCSFCRRPWAETGPLAEGPADVYVCGRCVDTSIRLFRSNGLGPPVIAAQPPAPPDEWNGNPVGSRCSFCGKSGRVAGSMLEGPDDLFLCVRCIDSAAAIVADLRREGKLRPAEKL
jgi:hypothetical protein